MADSIDRLFDYKSRLKKSKKEEEQKKKKPVMKKRDTSIKGRAKARKEKLGDIMNTIRQGR